MVGYAIPLEVLPRQDLLPLQVRQRKWCGEEGILGLVQDCKKLIPILSLTLRIALEEGFHPGFS